MDSDDKGLGIEVDTADMQGLIDRVYEGRDKRYITCLKVLKELIEEKDFQPSDLAMVITLAEVFLATGTGKSAAELRLMKDEQKLIFGACGFKRRAFPRVTTINGKSCIEHEEITEDQAKNALDALKALATSIMTTRTAQNIKDEIINRLVRIKEEESNEEPTDV